MGEESQNRFTELKAHARMPSIKGVALSVLEASLVEDVSLARLASIIMPDPALTARLIKTSNSALYPGSRPVASLQDAIAKLGLGQVRQTALGFALVSDNRERVCETFDYSSYWALSILRGALMKQACLMLRLGSAEEMFTLGLLSNIGELALVTAYPERYAQLLECSLEVKALRARELELFGIDAPGMSAALMEDWKLPEAFAQAALMESDALAPTPDRIKGLRALIAGAEKVASGWLELQAASKEERLERLRGPTLSMLVNMITIGKMGLPPPSAADSEDLARSSFEEAHGWLEGLAILPQIEARRGRLSKGRSTLEPPVDLGAASPKRPPVDRLLESNGHVVEIKALIGSTDSSSIKTIAQALAIRGGHMRALRSKEHLFDELLEFAPNALFLDYDPDPRFVAVLQTIKDMDRSKELLVVVICRSDHEARMGEVLAVGADDFLARPFSLAHASAKVSTAEKMAGVAAGLKSSRDDLKKYALEMESANKKLRQSALYDSLTGLPNRHLFNDRLAGALEIGPNQGRKIALVRIDLDKFKTINDSFGTPAGEEMIKPMAEKLKVLLRTGDSATRLGGNEFTVIFRDVADEAEAVERAGKLMLSLELSAPLPGKDPRVGISMGIALCPDHGAEAETLIKHAELALHKAKQTAKGSVQVYVKELSEEASKRFSIETALEKALDRREFSVHFQPRIDLVTGKMTGAEALLRWSNAEMGSISPEVFIPIAEETGAIEEIGEWALRESLRLAKPLLCEDVHFRLAVSLSARQFKSKSLGAQIAKILRAERFPACNLEVEVAESATMEDIFHAAKALEDLKTLGLSVSIGDFGTGYSSLSYLRRLPFDVLKIDKSFLLNALVDKDDHAISQMIAALAKTMGKGLVAEGVDTVPLAEFALRLGAQWGQGFLYSKAVPILELKTLLAKTW